MAISEKKVDWSLGHLLGDLQKFLNPHWTLIFWSSEVVKQTRFHTLGFVASLCGEMQTWGKRVRNLQQVNHGSKHPATIVDAFHLASSENTDPLLTNEYLNTKAKKKKKIQSSTVALQWSLSAIFLVALSNQNWQTVHNLLFYNYCFYTNSRWTWQGQSIFLGECTRPMALNDSRSNAKRRRMTSFLNKAQLAAGKTSRSDQRTPI